MSFDGVMRFIHIVAAMAWFGGLLFLTTRVIPAMENAGDAAFELQRTITRMGGFGRYFAPASILTILTGGHLYPAGDWFNRGGWERAMLETGVLAGVLAFALGIYMALKVERPMRALDDADSGQANWAPLVRKAKLSSHIMLGLVSIAVFGMAGRAMFY